MERERSAAKATYDHYLRYASLIDLLQKYKKRRFWNRRLLAKK